MNSYKLLLAGKQRAGKDQFAIFIREYAERRGGRVCTLRLSEPLYDCLEAVQKRLNLPLGKDRKFLQWLGTDWARKQNPNIFIELLLEQYWKDREKFDASAEYAFTLYLVVDARLQNELEELTSRGFKSILIKRGLFKRLLAGATHIFHASEFPERFKRFNCVLHNEGDIRDLRDAAEATVDLLLAGRQLKDWSLSPLYAHRFQGSATRRLTVSQWFTALGRFFKAF